MKILVITASYPPHHHGGYELRCKEVSEALVDRGHEISIITTHCLNNERNLHNNGPMIYRVLHEKLEARTILQQVLNDRKDINLINKKVKDYRPEIIYLWHIAPLSNAIFPYFSDQKIPIVYDEGCSGLACYSRIQKRGIYFYKNENDSLIKKFLKSSIYMFARLISFNMIKTSWSWPKDVRIYFNSNSALNYSRDLGAPVENASVIQSGIEISKFPYYQRDQISTPIRIIVPNRINPIKGTKDSLLLVRELMRNGFCIKLRIIGKIESKEYFEEISNTIKRNGLEEAVEYLPMVDQSQLARYYQESDICFFPSYKKAGLSRVPLEAMASGCVVISYGNEGSKEIIHDQKTGFIIAERDIRTATSLIEKLNYDPYLYQNISQNARSKIENEHTLERYLDSIEAYLYEGLQKNDKA